MPRGVRGVEEVARRVQPQHAAGMKVEEESRPRNFIKCCHPGGDPVSCRDACWWLVWLIPVSVSWQNWKATPVLASPSPWPGGHLLSEGGRLLPKPAHPVRSVLGDQALVVDDAI